MQIKYDPAKTLGRAISNIKYQLGKYYVRTGLTPPLPKIRVCRDFSNPSILPQDPYVITEWPLILVHVTDCDTQDNYPD